MKTLFVFMMLLGSAAQASDLELSVELGKEVEGATYFEGYFSFYFTREPGCDIPDREYHQGSIVMVPSGHNPRQLLVKEISLNDKKLGSKEKFLLRDLKKSPQDFTLVLEGRGKDGEYLFFGESRISSLKLGEKHQVKLEAFKGLVVRTLTFEIPEGEKAEDLVLNAGTDTSAWDPIIKGFHVWLPEGKEFEYQVQSLKDGRILAHGKI